MHGSFAADSIFRVTAAGALLIAGSIITCPGAVTLSAVGSNVRVVVGSLTLQNATLQGCSAPLTLDPTTTATASTTCGVVTRALTQDD